MTYFALILLPYLVGAGLISLGLRISPYLFVIGVFIIATTWIFG